MSTQGNGSTASFTPTCLLVEDSADDAYFFKRALKKSGATCELEHVLDGGAAIQFLRAVRSGGTRKPHVIFLDLKMPIMSGFDVLRWIQQQAFTPPLYVVVLSGSDHKADVVKAQELGASDYLVKPIAAQDLKDRLQRAIEAPEEGMPTPTPGPEKARDA